MTRTNSIWGQWLMVQMSPPPALGLMGMAATHILKSAVSLESAVAGTAAPVPTATASVLSRGFPNLEEQVLPV